MEIRHSFVTLEDSFVNRPIKMVHGNYSLTDVVKFVSLDIVSSDRLSLSLSLTSIIEFFKDRF